MKHHTCSVLDLAGSAGRRLALCTAVFCCLQATIATTALPARAVEQAPQWTVTSISRPTNFAPGDGAGAEDAYFVVVTNTGGASSDGSLVTIAEELPQGLSPAGGASGEDEQREMEKASGAKLTCGMTACTYSGVVVPEDRLVVRFPVDVSLTPPAPPFSAPASCIPQDAVTCLTNVVHVSGGGAVDASVATPTTISHAQAGFGISPGGASTALSSTQAGAHPDITTSIAFNTVKGDLLAGYQKDLITNEPPGFALDLADTDACSAAAFTLNQCPIGSQVGMVSFVFGSSQTSLFPSPVYNLSPNPGDVAKLGFKVVQFGIQGEVAVRPDGGGVVTFHNTDIAAELDYVSLTLWGVPVDPIHNTWRAKPVEGGTGGQIEFGASSDAPPAPYFTNPTACEGAALEATFQATSWEHPDPSESPPPVGMQFGPMTGCDRLSFPAAFQAVASTDRASAPSGLDVNLDVKQTYANPHGLASSTLKKAVVTLPEGMTVNPSAGVGLGACTQAEYEEEALELSAARGCPADSTLGTVAVQTPLLKERGTGQVFLAQPYANPFRSPEHPSGSLIALYIVIRFPERGVIVKLAGEVDPDPTTGRLVTTFEGVPLNNGEVWLPGLPPLPFSSFEFKFIQGPTSPLVSPPVCGSYSIVAALTPWAEPQRALEAVAPAFPISEGFEEGSPCPAGATPPFKPDAAAGTLNNVAGSYSPLNLRITRNDGEQEITRFSSQLPPGLTANLSGVPFCPDAAIDAARAKTGAQEESEPSCPSASLIGHTLVGAGVGPVLAYAPGRVYMAGPYNGAPFSIVAITSAKVGPFDLGTVVVREALEIDPRTAVVTVDARASDPIPHIIKGIVVHVRDIRVHIDRQAFMLNPTSCEHLSFALTVSGGGADPANPADQVPVTVQNPFQAADCENLQFKPAFKVSTSARTSRKRGASLKVRLTYPNAPAGTQANIRSVKVALPRQLPSRLTTLQKACPDSIFDQDPAMCPQASRVGYAIAVTPILPVPLAGPAYFVSHGGAKFPELVLVLEGYGVTVDLHGETFISNAGITSSTFRAVPDQPVTSFELTLPQGPSSALTANGSLCKRKLRMPTAFTAQNGDFIHQSTPIHVIGCTKRKAGVGRKRRRKGVRRGK
jgi:hypothetical protein